MLNAANEVAVAAFLDRKISFLGIGRACREALSGLVLPAPKSLSDIYAADREARSFVDSPERVQNADRLIPCARETLH